MISLPLALFPAARLCCVCARVCVLSSALLLKWKSIFFSKKSSKILVLNFGGNVHFFFSVFFP